MGRVPRRDGLGTDRRRFIGGASAAVLAPWLTGGVDRALPADPMRERAVVGYLGGSRELVRRPDLLRALDDPGPGMGAWLVEVLRGASSHGPPGVILAADSLPSGDPKLARRPPVLWIHGLLPAAARRRARPRSIAVEVEFPVRSRPGHGDGSPRLQGVVPATFVAWRRDSVPVACEGRPIALRVPVRADWPLRLEVVIREGASVDGAAADCDRRLGVGLTLAGGRGSARLLPGTYLVGLDRAAGGRLPMLVNGDSLVADDFPCLAFSVLDSAEMDS